MSDRPPAPIVEAETFESTPSTSDPTFKYYQIAVPSFSFNQTGDQTGVTRTVPNVPGDPTAGSSFLRLGDFPDVTNPTMGPAGFANSLALANAVGDAASIPTAMDSLLFGYAGDPTYVLGFANDSRVQKKQLAPNQGFDETKVLLTKGGWWDHSDGNRVSTTAGDKIEIIQGNYKMIVLGRQPDPASGVIRDLSGGMNQENNQTPTNCVKSIEYTQDYGGEWTLYQYNGIGNVVSAFYGSVGDIYFGKLKESWTGLAPGGFTSKYYAQSLAQDPDSGPIAGKEDPDIKDYTWAKSITSWTGSYNKPIPTIEENTYANSITSTTGSAAMPITSIVESTYATSTTSTTTVTGAVTDTSTLGSSTSTTTVQGAISETTSAASTTSSTTVEGAISESTSARSISSSTSVSTTISESTTAGAVLAQSSVGPVSGNDLFLAALSKGSVAVAPMLDDTKVGALVTNTTIAAIQTDLFLGVMKQAIDLAPINLHYGIESQHVAVFKNVTAAITKWSGEIFLGDPPEPAAAAPTLGDMADVADDEASAAQRLAAQTDADATAAEASATQAEARAAAQTRDVELNWVNGISKADDPEAQAALAANREAARARQAATSARNLANAARERAGSAAQRARDLRGAANDAVQDARAPRPPRPPLWRRAGRWAARGTGLAAGGAPLGPTAPILGPVADGDRKTHHDEKKKGPR